MRKSTLWLATLILLTAAGLRLWALAEYPPGPHYDEAANVQITRGIAYGGALLDFFPVVPNYQGREVLYFAMAAPFFHLFGGEAFTLRLVSVFSGIITVAASMALGRAMFPGRRGRVIMLAVGVMMALAFPHIWLSRQAFRSVTQPLFQALALIFLWRGVTAQQNSRRLLILSGFFGGLVMYTYYASRLFPLWMGLALLILIALDAGGRVHRFRQAVIVGVALGVTAAPVGVYALQHPDIYLGRLAEVTTYGDQVVTLGESIVRHLRMFFISGETLLRYNPPGRPYLTPPEGALMLLGLAVTVAGLWQNLNLPGSPRLKSWRSRRSPAKAGLASAKSADESQFIGTSPVPPGNSFPAPVGMAYALALLTPLMVIPSVIALGGYPPNHSRSLGIVPLIYVLVALGFEAIFSPLADRLHKRLPAFTPARLLAAVILAALLVGAPLAGNVYFTWAGRADLFYDADGDIAAIVDWLPGHVTPETRVYFTGYHYHDPNLEIAFGDALPHVSLKRESLLWPPPGFDGLLLYPRSAEPLPAWVDLLADYAVTDGLPIAPDLRPAFTAYRIPAGAPPPFTPSADAPHNAYLTLAGVEAAAIPAGETGHAITAWRVESTPPFPDMMPILQLEDAAGHVLSRAAYELVDSDRWQPDATLLQRLPVEVPPGTPPGDYALRVAWVARGEDRYLPYGGGQVWADVGALRVDAPTTYPDPADFPLALRLDAAIAPGVTLLGWDGAEALTLRPGESIPAALAWYAPPNEAPRPTVTVEAVLVDDTGAETVVWAGEPLAENYPITAWPDGAVLLVRDRWPTAHTLPNGAYTLALRLTAAGGDPVTVTVAAVNVEGAARQFEPPPVATMRDLRYGDAITLHGYTLTADGSTLSLTLAWRAEAIPDRDYTVFVHVLDADGVTVTQQDRPPGNPPYPTALWIGGEYITDAYTFAGLPPGEYTLRVGLYSQADGARLPVTESDGEPLGDFLLLEGVMVGGG